MFQVIPWQRKYVGCIGVAGVLWNWGAVVLHAGMQMMSLMASLKGNTVKNQDSGFVYSSLFAAELQVMALPLL